MGSNDQLIVGDLGEGIQVMMLVEWAKLLRILTQGRLQCGLDKTGSKYLSALLYQETQYTVLRIFASVNLR